MQVYSMQEFESFIPKRKTFALFGSSAAFSLSPSLHNEIFRRCGTDAEYIAITATCEELPRALELAREKLAGFNCTIPFKQTIIPYLAQADKRVSVLGAANTIVVKNGEFFGYNTDGQGFSSALRLSSVTLTEKRLLLLGCGGAALSIAFEAAVCGASHVTVAARSREKAMAFINRVATATGLDIFDFQPIDSVCGEYDILVNATPVGMGESADESPIDLARISGLTFVYDCIYHPPMPQLLNEAEARGIRWDNGLSMLVLQGVQAQYHWMDIPPYSDELLGDIIDFIGVKQARERLKEVHGSSNIALTGFMGCGKTTIGKKLAALLGMDFIDLDQKIEAEQGTTISDIFEKRGEMYFRDLETLACHDLVKLENTVIATGGGTVIRDRNAEILKENCLILFLYQTLEQIEQNLSGSYARPLLQVQNVSEHIKSLYDFRTPQYLEKSDIAVRFPKGTPDNARHTLMHI